jgi:hypothetical protein
MGPEPRYFRSASIEHVPVAVLQTVSPGAPRAVLAVTWLAAVGEAAPGVTGSGLAAETGTGSVPFGARKCSTCACAIAGDRKTAPMNRAANILFI